MAKLNGQLEKLPKWAQEYIADLEREREMAIRTLNQYTDNQTASPFYVDELVCTGEEQGPTHKRKYIQTCRMVVEHAGVELTILLRHDDRIELSWAGRNGQLRDIGAIPRSYQSIDLLGIQTQAA